MSNDGYRFYENVLGSPKFILAPMVEQSELAFRCLSRELGSQLCYTPMWHAGIFASDEKYRKAAIESAPNDRPLLFQVNIFVQSVICQQIPREYDILSWKISSTVFYLNLFS